MTKQHDLSDFENSSGSDLEGKESMSDWIEYTFSDVIDINDYPKLEKNVEQTHVGMKHLGENIRKIKDTIKKEYKYSKPRFENGDTLFARITPCLENGKTAYVDILNEGEAATGSTEFLVMSATDKILPKYVYYTARRPKVRQFAIKRMTGSSGRQRVPTDVFDNLTIELPPINEQKSIVNILDSIDGKIECNNEMNNLLQDSCEAIFEGEFPEIVEYISGTRTNLPAREIKTFGEISNNFDNEREPLSQAERDERPGPYPYYGATGPLDYIDDLKFSGKYLLVAEDGTVETENGYPYIQFLNKEFWPSNHVHILQGADPVSTEYLRWALSYVKIDPYITGSVQPKLSQTNLNSIELPVPDESEIQYFTEQIKPLHQRIWQNERENETLSDLRDALLPKLMSGEIRLTGKSTSG